MYDGVSILRGLEIMHDACFRVVMMRVMARRVFSYSEYEHYMHGRYFPVIRYDIFYSFLHLYGFVDSAMLCRGYHFILWILSC